MSSLEEFNGIFENFRTLYKECSDFIAKGIELETSDDEEVS